MLKKIDKELLLFFVITSVFLVVCSIFYYNTSNSLWLIVLMLTPALSVVISKLICKEGFKDLYMKPNIKGNVKWYLASYFLTPFIAFFGAAIHFLIFKNDFDPLNSYYSIEGGISTENEYIISLLVLIPLAISINPMMGIFQCFGEEFAWRSYLLPKLSENFSTRTAVLINGIIWGIWHSPIIAMGYNYGNEHPVFGIFAMILFCMVIGIISSYLFYKTKSVWCSVLFHASINGMDKWAPSSLFMSENANKFIGPDLLGIIGGSGFVILAVVLFIQLKNPEKIQCKDNI